jgi:ATP phosphoribosyltransferase
MLTLALAKGRLLEPLAALLEARGVPLARALADAGRTLVVELDGLRVLLLKDADVPVYVEQGIAECGVVGLDQVLEQQVDVLRLLRLPFGHCRLCLVARRDEPLAERGRPLLLASKYPRLTTELAARRGRHVAVIPLAGSVELAAVLGLADAVVDLVATGQTLRENGLVPVEEWLHVVPYLIVNRAALYFAGDEIRALRRTLGGPR